MPAGLFANWLHEGEQLAGRRGAPGHQAAPSAGGATAADHGGEHGGGAYRRLARAVRRASGPVEGSTLIAALAILVGYGLWQVFRWGGHRHQALIGDLAFVPVNGAVILYAWRVSLRADLGRPTSRGWRLLTAAFCLFLLGDLLQLFYEVELHKRAYPTWADAAYLSFYVVAFAGLLSFPSRRRPRSERLRLTLDMGTVFLGGATFIWYVALGPAAASARGFHLADLVTFAYPVGDLLLLFGVLWRGAPRVLSLKIFATGLFVFIAADVIYDYITVHSTYLGGDPVDSLWILALTIVFVAASCQLRAEPPGEYANPLESPAASPSVLPYLAVAGSYVLLTVVGLRDVKLNPLGGVLLGAVALTALVSVRQFAALRDNSRLAVRYRALASIDGITGLYNRRYFMEVAEGLFAHAHRLGQPLAALMIDVDNFKQINDMHGHAVGDRVLADLARSCREHAAPDDIAGRYGGDEFVIMIPGTAGAGAARIAARLTGPLSRVAGRAGAPVKFTVRVGVAEAAGCRDLQSLLARADHALYEAKRAGRACCRTFEETAQAPDPVVPAARQ